MTDDTKPLEFRGGPLVSILPLFIFIGITATLVYEGAVADEGMILAVMIGLSVGMIFSRNMAGYSERVFSLMANRVATVAVVCWLWAGAFAGILKDCGLVEAIVWVGWKLDMTGAAFTLAVFISSALFAVSVGTGLGTVVGFTAVMYPAGIVLGANPAALMGAIFSGAAFGDNLAPISDTTIVSAATQETDVPGVVKSRLKYVLIAAGISALFFVVLGGGGQALDGEIADKLMEDNADPAGLWMLIPGVIVFVVAVSGRHFLAALTAGIATSLLIVLVWQLGGSWDWWESPKYTLGKVVHLTENGRNLDGSVIRGAMGMVPVSVLTLLLVAANGIMQAGGFLDRLMGWLNRTVARTVRGAEAAIVGLISFLNVCVSVNTVAMITAGPLANELRKRHGIHPYRSANLLDTISCSFPYILPWAAHFVVVTGIHEQVAETYDFAPILTWGEMAPYMFYGMILFPLMLVAVGTGYGRKKG